jgi:hypothetical protein
MQGKSQTAPSSEMLKKIVEAKKEELARLNNGRANRIKEAESLNKQRSDILKAALPKEMQAAWDDLQKLSEKGLNGRKSNAPKIRQLPEVPTSDGTRAKPTAAGQPGKTTVHTDLKPVFAMCYVNGHEEAYTWNPGGFLLDLSEESSGLGNQIGSDIGIYSLFVYTPEQANTTVEYVANTNGMKGSYTIADGGWGSGASVYFDLGIDIHQGAVDLPGTAKNMWTVLSDGGKYSTPQPFNVSFSVSCTNTVPGTDTLLIWVMEFFNVFVNTGFFSSASAGWDIDGTGDYVSNPSLTVSETLPG